MENGSLPGTHSSKPLYLSSSIGSLNSKGMANIFSDCLCCVQSSTMLKSSTMIEQLTSELHNVEMSNSQISWSSWTCNSSGSTTHLALLAACLPNLEQKQPLIAGKAPLAEDGMIANVQIWLPHAITSMSV